MAFVLIKLLQKLAAIAKELDMYLLDVKSSLRGLNFETTVVVDPHPACTQLNYAVIGTCDDAVTYSLSCETWGRNVLGIVWQASISKMPLGNQGTGTFRLHVFNCYGRWTTYNNNNNFRQVLLK